MLIYLITCKVNNKIYVGKTSKSLEERKSNHFKKHTVKKSSMLIYRAMLKYGFDNFKWDIIEECKELDELDKREIYWIKELNATDKKVGYNSTTGGTGGDTYTNNINYESICNKHRILMLNETEDAKNHRTLKLKNQKRSKSTCNKISKARLGMKFTENHKANISIKTKEAMKDIDIYNKVKVDCFTLDDVYIKTFSSLSEASKELDINKNSIFKNCKSKRNRAGNFKFKYANV